MRRILLAILLLTPTLVWSQAQPAGNQPRVDSPSEIDQLKENCGAFTPKGALGCAEELFTGKPVHIAVGSIAPQNGFGAGLAVGGFKDAGNWRNTWDGDAIGSINASWRAGVYFQFIHSGGKAPSSQKGVPKKPIHLGPLPEHTVYSLYGQIISLNKLTFFGLGPESIEANRTFYGMRQTVIGGNVVKPISDRWKTSFFGEMNGRFVNIRPATGEPSPTTQALFTEATAPGLTNQPGTLQFGEGLRMARTFSDDIVRLNYKATYQQFFAADSFTFQRLTFDLGHTFSFYSTTRSLQPRSGNGPNSCAETPGTGDQKCPPALSRNLEGGIGIRALTALSMTPGGNLVPFYFQPTLGGSDINGNQALPSYQDYRFRAPNLLLFQEDIEHSIFKWPIGMALMANQGKVALARGDLGSNAWRHSYAAGLTLRAGGFPQVWLMFAWGGNEGTHTIAHINTSLLGGAARPSLY